MTYVRKPGAPLTFGLKQAFTALITGDAQWGWLLDWMPLLVDAYLATDDFCALGPVFTEPLNVVDFIPSANPLDPKNAVSTLGLAARIGAAARDRVFGAYCELVAVDDGTGYWTDWDCQTFHDPGAFRAGHVWVLNSDADRIEFQVTNLVAGDYPPGQLRFGDYPVTIATGPGSYNGDYDIHPLTIPAAPYNGAFWIEWRNNAAVTMCVRQHRSGAGANTPYGPTEQPQPAGVIDPLGSTGADLTAIAHELDVQEAKLDFLMQLVQYLTSLQNNPGSGVEDPVTVEPDVPVNLKGAVGVIITLEGIPTGAKVGFGNPQQYAKVARVNFQTPAGWYPTLPVTHTPFIVRPLPPETEDCTVTMLLPGVTASVAKILPPK